MSIIENMRCKIYFHTDKNANTYYVVSHDMI